MYVRKYTTKLVLNSWLSFDWNTYNYVHISSTIEIYSGVLRSTPEYSPEWRKCLFLLRRAGVENVQNWGFSTTLLNYNLLPLQALTPLSLCASWPFLVKWTLFWFRPNFQTTFIFSRQKFLRFKQLTLIMKLKTSSYW